MPQNPNPAVAGLKQAAKPEPHMRARTTFESLTDPINGLLTDLGNNPIAQLARKLVGERGQPEPIPTKYGPMPTAIGEADVAGMLGGGETMGRLAQNSAKVMNAAAKAKGQPFLPEMRPLSEHIRSGMGYESGLMNDYYNLAARQSPEAEAQHIISQLEPTMGVGVSKGQGRLPFPGGDTAPSLRELAGVGPSNNQVNRAVGGMEAQFEKPWSPDDQFRFDNQHQIWGDQNKKMGRNPGGSIINPAAPSPIPPQSSGHIGLLQALSNAYPSEQVMPKWRGQK